MFDSLALKRNNGFKRVKIIKKSKNISFYDFLKQYRPSISYSEDYCYLRKPIRMILDGEKEINICKGSQTGASEMVISLTLYLMVEKQKNILYLLPTASDASDFSAARFNTIIESNTDIKSLFSYDNVGHKRYKSSNLYIRGSNSASRLKSVPVNILIIDERDEISDESAEIVHERLSGSKEKQIINISTPTLPDRGIWKLTRRNTEYNFFVSCLFCNQNQVINIENIDFQQQTYRCRYCKKPWTQEQKMQMIIDAVSDKKAGWQKVSEGTGIFFHVSQFLSPTITALEICQKYQESDTEIRKQVFHNHKLGLPYVAEGTKLTRDIIEKTLGKFNTDNFIRVAGIDVSQSNLHYCVVVSIVDEIGLAVEDFFRVSWEDMKRELKRRGVACVVIDANPERHSARNFLQGWDNEGALALYPNGIKELFEVVEKETKYIKIARTEVLDIVLNRFRQDTILIHEGLKENNGEYENFVRQLMSVVRMYREIRGQIEAYYTETGDDHYTHALAYAEIASRLIFTNISESVIDGSFI